MFQLKPAKKNLNRSQNDTGGYFDLAKIQLLGNIPQFLKQMIEYDKDNIDEKVVRKVNGMLESDKFSMAEILGASQALGGIMKWVQAMMKYHELLKIVKPKRAKVAQMNEALDIVRARLDEKMKQLAAVEELMASLEAMYNAKLETERQLVAKIDDCNKKLERAEKIIIGLQDEKIKWQETVERLTREADLLIGDCLVAAGMVAYSGPFTAKFRTELE